MKTDPTPALPDWFDTALNNTGQNYQRIDVLKLACPYCGCVIHVATNWIGLPKQIEGVMPIKYFRASVYPFCACAQAMDSERLINIADRAEEWWTFAADWYHEKIAKPDSDKHRENLLQGYPTWHLLKFIIDPNQENDPPSFTIRGIT
jgi:hypothetical protein